MLYFYNILCKTLEKKMGRNYTLRTQISKPVAEVYDAIVSKDKLSKYFTNKSSSDLKEGELIIWNWYEWGDFPVVVKKLIPHKLIELALDSKEWKKTEDEAYEVLVIFEFEELDDNRTMLSISESGWKTDNEGLKASHENCGGWQHMSMCLKGYLEHGIDLR